MKSCGLESIFLKYIFGQGFINYILKEMRLRLLTVENEWILTGREVVGGMGEIDDGD